MEDSTELISARDDVLRKIGRNVVAFQKMEVMMKFLIANHKIEGLPDRLQESLDKNRSEVDMETMGALVNKLFRTVIPAGSKSDNDQYTDDRLWTVSFRVDMDATARSERKDGFESVVNERNKLIHQQIGNLDTRSLQSCLALAETLDTQRDAIEPYYKHLRSMITTVLDGRRDLFEYLTSESFPAAVENADRNA